MQISILTLFPDMFSGPFSQSIIKRAQTQGSVTISLINIRDFAADKYRTVDGRPYGGGQGMILRVDVVDRCLSDTLSKIPVPRSKTRVILLDASGDLFAHQRARQLSAYDHLIIICGHYEGVDARIFDLADTVVSVGDFIVTGGELPAMLVVDSVIRLLPGVLKTPAAIEDESFAGGLLEYPQYTRPETYHGHAVPQVLLSGNHRDIRQWRLRQATKRTRKKRPDLTKKSPTGRT